MCLWKDKYTPSQLVASREALADQLKLYAKPKRSRCWNGCADYFQWLEKDFQTLEGFADALLELCAHRPRLKPIAANLLWEIEMSGQLPHRRLQCEFFELDDRPLRASKVSDSTNGRCAISHASDRLCPTL